MNNASINHREQRAGNRMAVEHFARVVVPGGGRWLGLMTNASHGGTYVRMLGKPSRNTPVVIQPVNSVEVLKGIVARVDDGGIGVQWLSPQVASLGVLNRKCSRPLERASA